MKGFLKKISWLGLGVLAAYLLDPVQGRSRRARLSDQMRAKVRDAKRYAAKKARYQAGRLRGIAHEVTGSDAGFVSDDTLLQKVRSEAIGPTSDNLTHIGVNVVNGVVVLTGTSRDPRAEHELVRRINKVGGVRSVRNDLVAS